LLAALEGEGALPPLSTMQCRVLIAPGLTGLARRSDATERALWHALAEPTTVVALLRRGHSRDAFANFLACGAAEQA
jgi:hypothetical protein